MADTVILRALNDHVRNFMSRMVEGLSDEQVRYSAPAIDARSIAGVVVHAYSGVFFLAYVMAGKEQPAMPVEPTTTADLLALLDSIHVQVAQMLADLPDGALEQTYTMPWRQKLSGLEAFSAALAHSLVHAGNIQGIRAIGGFPTPPESY
ncbi:MAG: DinB family protein [Chloroflexota bacterium]|nr:DinB family protein [Chloroflexota bacterium]